MNNSTNERDRAARRWKLISGGLIMLLVLSGCAYFLPSHPIVVTAVIFGFLLSIWREREARQVFGLAFSHSLPVFKILLSSTLKVFGFFLRPFQRLGIFPKNDN